MNQALPPCWVTHCQFWAHDRQKQEKKQKQKKWTECIIRLGSFKDKSSNILQYNKTMQSVILDQGSSIWSYDGCNPAGFHSYLVNNCFHLGCLGLDLSGYQQCFQTLNFNFKRDSQGYDIRHLQTVAILHRLYFHGHKCIWEFSNQFHNHVKFNHEIN